MILWKAAGDHFYRYVYDPNSLNSVTQALNSVCLSLFSLQVDEFTAWKSERYSNLDAFHGD